VDAAIKGTRPERDALAVVSSATRPDGPLDDGERARAQAIFKIVERRLRVETTEAAVAASRWLSIAALVAPGTRLPQTTRDQLRDIIAAHTNLGGYEQLAYATVRLLPDDDDLIRTVMLIEAQSLHESTVPRIETLARRVLAGGAKGEQRVEALERLLEAVAFQKRWPEARQLARDAERAAAAPDAKLGEQVALRVAAKASFVRARAASAGGDFARALAELDAHPSLQPLLKDGFALARIEALTGLGRRDDAVAEGVRYARSQPLPGQYGGTLAEAIWHIASEAHREKELAPMLQVAGAWTSKDPIWVVRGALILAENGDGAGAARHYAPLAAEHSWPALPGLASDEPAAIERLRALERDLDAERRRAPLSAR
jgi:hypothetical protein